MSQLLQLVADGLGSEHPARALELLRDWSLDKPFLSLRSEILDKGTPLSVMQRRRLTAAAYDLLSNYPTVLYGMPVLIRADTEDLAIMLPAPSNFAPLAGEPVLSWCSLRQCYAGYSAAGPEIETNTTYVGMVKIATGDVDAPIIPDAWVADAIGYPAGVKLTVMADRVLPWPAAVEAGIMLLSVGRQGSPEDIPTIFLDGAEKQWATDAALIWRRTVVASR